MLCQSHTTFQVNNLNLVIPFPNVAKTLSKLKKKNIKIGAITSRGSDTVAKTLHLAEIDTYIDSLITSSDVKKLKPHKEPVIKILKMLKVLPQHALLVGDTETDILTGKNAQVKTVGATYGFLGKDIAKFNPDFVIDDIEKLLEILS